MLLILVFFIFAQFLTNSQAIKLMKMRERQKEMEKAISVELPPETSEEISVETHGNLQRFRFSDQILFETAEANLKRKGEKTLTKVGQIFLKHRYYSDEKGKRRKLYKGIHIEGHADIRPISTPKYKSNWELSTARAIEVLKFFLNKFNAFKEKPKLLSAVGYGPYHPVPGHSLEEYDIHRRIEIVLEYAMGE